MTLTLSRGLAPLLATLVAFACVLAVLMLRDGGDTPSAPTRPAPDLGAPLRPDASTDALIARLQGAVRAGGQQRPALAGAYLQKARETGDPGFYSRADAVLAPALARGSDPDALAEAAALAAARHDFHAALRLARRSRALRPDALEAYPVLVDALVELGRYDEAERTLQRFTDLRPSLPAYARISYLRELNGDLGGAVDAMQAAIAAGGAVPENVASVQTLLGHLELTRGNVAAAGRAFDTALNAMPGYVAAEAGRARVAAQRGAVGEAISRWRRVVARLPLPEYVIGLGEAELAAGRRARAQRDLALVGAERALLANAGVNTDVELAIYEADHGDPARGVGLARAAWMAAPSIRSADALGWALTRAGRPRAGLRWSDRALRLGWLDPVARFHAGMAALASGHAARGERQLRIALHHGLRGFPLQAQRAERALRGAR
jgi:tetratricopeptide (TPR) repeat protein